MPPIGPGLSGTGTSRPAVGGDWAMLDDDAVPVGDAVLGDVQGRSLLGRPARDGLAGVDSLTAALALARGVAAVPAGLEDAAEGLRRAYDAIERARALVAPSKKRKRAVRKVKGRRSGRKNP